MFSVQWLAPRNQLALHEQKILSMKKSGRSFN
jgi:hypothetical protein